MAARLTDWRSGNVLPVSVISDLPLSQSCQLVSVDTLVFFVIQKHFLTIIFVDESWIRRFQNALLLRARVKILNDDFAILQDGRRCRGRCLRCYSDSDSRFPYIRWVAFTLHFIMANSQLLKSSWLLQFCGNTLKKIIKSDCKKKMKCDWEIIRNLLII